MPHLICLRPFSFSESGQATSDELRSKDFKRELEERERKGKRSAGRSGAIADERPEVPRFVPFLPPFSFSVSFGVRYFEQWLNFCLVFFILSKKTRPEPIAQANLDADDVNDDDDSDDDAGSDDDEAELMAELQRIKRERAQEIAKKVRDHCSSRPNPRPSFPNCGSRIRKLRIRFSQI